jgi:segregation and condensation protein B
MEETRLKSLLESLIFVAESPLTLQDMSEAIYALEASESEAGAGEATGELAEEEEAAIALPSETTDPSEQIRNYASQEENKISKSDIANLLQQIAQEFAANPARGLILTEVAGGWQFRTRPENAAIIRQFYHPKPTKLSKPSLETLSIVAYRQPITRAEIDEIRGVDSGGVLKTLLEKNLLRIVGKKEEPGKPMLYGTTHEFLELFQLKSLKELPSLRDYRDLESEFRKNSAEEGVIVENEGEAEPLNLTRFAEEAALAASIPEEAEMLEGLEESLQQVRHLEREIFPSEKKKEEPEEGVPLKSS